MGYVTSEVHVGDDSLKLGGSEVEGLVLVAVKGGRVPGARILVIVLLLVLQIGLGLELGGYVGPGLGSGLGSSSIPTALFARYTRSVKQISTY